MSPEEQAYHELCAYTLTHGGPEFIHQHVVDSFAAQHADERTKPITITFALVGLYLHMERNVSGRDVQRIHMQLARRKRTWPSFTLPRDRGSMTALDVLAAPPGVARDHAIDAWCASVWNAWMDTRAEIASLLAEYGIE